MASNIPSATTVSAETSGSYSLRTRSEGKVKSPARTGSGGLPGVIASLRRQLAERDEALEASQRIIERKDVTIHKLKNLLMAHNIPFDDSDIEDNDRHEDISDIPMADSLTMPETPKAAKKGQPKSPEGAKAQGSSPAKTQIAVFGQRLLISIDVSNNARTEWSREGGLPSKCEMDAGRLVLPDVNFEDQGLYVCKVIDGSFTYHHKIDVRVVPQGDFSGIGANKSKDVRDLSLNEFFGTIDTAYKAIPKRKRRTMEVAKKPIKKSKIPKRIGGKKQVQKAPEQFMTSTPKPTRTNNQRKSQPKSPESQNQDQKLAKEKAVSKSLRKDLKEAKDKIKRDQDRYKMMKDLVNTILGEEQTQMKGRSQRYRAHMAALQRIIATEE